MNQQPVSISNPLRHLLALLLIVCALALSPVLCFAQEVFRGDEQSKPYTHLSFQNAQHNFQFAVVGDRTGGEKTRLMLRSTWAKAAPVTSRLNPMGSIKLITVHHEGWTPVFFTGADLTAQRLDLVRRSHIERMDAGDIGYHFIIDRAGLLWHGRELRYQGAHVKDHNSNNLGIMVLGNFDLQQPTAQPSQVPPRNTRHQDAAWPVGSVTAPPGNEPGHLSWHHSFTFPCMSYNPHAFGK